MNRRIRVVQHILQEKGLYDGAIDGIAGPITVRTFASIDEVNSSDPKTRQITRFMQAEANRRGIDAGR